MSLEFLQDDIVYSRRGTYRQLLRVRVYDIVHPCLPVFIVARLPLLLFKRGVSSVKCFACQTCDRLCGTSAEDSFSSQLVVSVLLTPSSGWEEDLRRVEGAENESTESKPRGKRRPYSQSSLPV